MDYAPVINSLLKVWWLIPLALILGILKSPWFKGLVGEGLVKFAAYLRLRSDTYHAVHNVTLPTEDGTTQIDHVFVSRFGIFVVETKHMRGWIFGTENEAQWTQSIFGSSFRFQNPLRQNYKHVRALQAVLAMPAEAIHSVVVFSGGSIFKSPMPANVTRGMGYIAYIKSFRQPVLSDAQVEGAMARIQSVRLSPSLETNRQHIRSLGARRALDPARTCPRCGNPMVLRTSKHGQNVGKQFWGCSSYPRCKAVQSVA
jgi:restriction system protein